jgi:hypothetical protein
MIFKSYNINLSINMYIIIIEYFIHKLLMYFIDMITRIF